MTKKKSIRGKISKLIIVIVSLCLVIFGAISTWLYKVDKEKFITDSHSIYVRNLARQIDNEFKHQLNSVNTLQTQLKNSNWTYEQARPFLNTNTGILSFFVYQHPDSKLEYSLINQNLLILSGLSAHEVQNISQRATELKNIPTGVHLWFNISLQNMFLMTALEDKKLIVYLIDKSFLHAMLEESGIYWSIAISNAGDILAQSPNPSHPPLQKEQLTAYPPWQQITGFSTIAGGSEYTWPTKTYDEHKQAENYIGYFARANESIYVVSAVNKSIAFAQVYEQLLTLALVAGLMLLFFILLGVRLSSSLTEPLKKLSALTEEIAAGNYLVKANITTRDEIQELSQSFMNLGQKLHNREEELEKVTEMAIRDAMTGLHNNRYFRAELEKDFSHTTRHKERLCIALIDVDYFKKVNDTYGHLQGDDILKGLGQILKEHTRLSDLAARYGGEEFVCLLRSSNLEGAKTFGEKIRKAFQDSVFENLSGGEPLRCTMSIGLACYDGSNFKNTELFIATADANLYKAKEGGRNRVVG